MAFSPQTIKLLRLLAPLSALTTSTMIAGFSYLQSPILESLSSSSPSRSLHHIRGYFEQGKYIFPQMAMISTTLFGALAYAEPDKLVGYSIAAAGCFGILPFTSLYMIPITNNRILELDDRASQGGKEGDEVEKKKGEEVARLIGDFRRENWVRAGMYWVGGVVGLWTVLS